MNTVIYADHAATTRLSDKALQAMLPWLQEEYGNPSQPYSFSRKPKKAIAEARETIASCIGAQPDEIFFTSGGTESDNWAIKGTALSHGREGQHLNIMLSSVPVRQSLQMGGLYPTSIPPKMASLYLKI